MKFIKLFVLITVSTILLGGCSQKALFVEYSKLDLSDKSITIPAGGDLFLTEIKRGLIEDGWDIQVYDSSVVTTTTGATKETFTNYHTKYRLLIQYMKHSENNVIFAYDVSVLDNKNGKEAMTIHQNANPLVGKFAKESANDILSWFRGQAKERFKEDDRSMKDKVTDWAKSVVK